MRLLLIGGMVVLLAATPARACEAGRLVALADAASTICTWQRSRAYERYMAQASDAGDFSAACYGATYTEARQQSEAEGAEAWCARILPEIEELVNR